MIGAVLKKHILLVFTLTALIAMAMIYFSWLYPTLGYVFIVILFVSLWAMIVLYETALREKGLKLDEKNRKFILQADQQKNLLRYYSRFVAMEEMLGMVTVQWKQPLVELGFHIREMEESVLSSYIDKERVKAIISDSMSQVSYLSATMDDFRAFFRLDKTKSIFDVSDSVEDLLVLISAAIKKRGINLTTDVKSIYVQGYSNEFKQALLSLMNNSIEAICDNKDCGEGECNTDNFISIYSTVEFDNLHLFVEDSGGGIPTSTLNNIFDPYFTTKAEGGGGGLGLYMTKMIIENHMNGSISIKNTDRGARVEIVLKRFTPAMPQ
jgi:signal transduction histidine kinase